MAMTHTSTSLLRLAIARNLLRYNQNIQENIFMKKRSKNLKCSILFDFKNCAIMLARFNQIMYTIYKPGFTRYPPHRSR